MFITYAAPIGTTSPNGADPFSVAAQITGYLGAAGGNVPHRSVRNTSVCGTTPVLCKPVKARTEVRPPSSYSREADRLTAFVSVCAMYDCVEEENVHARRPLPGKNRLDFRFKQPELSCVDGS